MQEGGKKQILFAVEDVNTKIRYLRILFTCDMEKLNNNKNKRGPGADEMKNPGMENKDKEDDFSDDMEYFGESEDMMSPVSVEDVNTKIRYLRILFTCDMEKLNNNKNKRGPGADEMKNPGMENKDKEDDFSDDMEYFGESEDMMSPTSEAFEDFGSPDTPISSTSREITPIPPIRRLEKSKLQETELKNVAVNTLRAIQNTLHNDYLHFGQFIAESIEKLPALKAKIFRHGVLKLLMQIEDEED